MTPPSGTVTDPVVELLNAERSDYRGLYYRWEKEQWEAGAIDLTRDAVDWKALDAGVRAIVAGAIGWRHLRARSATTALVPFVDGAPDEEQQVFLTTELVDEARHIVLFDRFSAEVMGEDASTVTDRAPAVDDPALRELLLEAFPAVSAELAKAARPGLGLLAEAVTSYQIAVVGLLGLAEQAALDELLSSQGILPGLTAGLALAGRDSVRHVAFALRVLQETSATEPDAMTAVGARLRGLLPVVERALGRTGGVRNEGGSQQAAQLGYAAWFEAVGVEPPL